MNVLIGVGGSALSSLALETTVERALETGDSLTVAVFDSEEVEADPERIANDVEERLAEADVEWTVRTIEGDPGSQLVDIAEAEDFDRIVLGSGKRSTLGKIQLGTVAEFVLLNARTPVTLIR